MKNKTIWWVLAIILISIVGFSISKQTLSGPEVKVGFILPLTGDAAVYGESAKKAADLAVSDLEKKNGVKIIPIYEDSQLSPALSASAAHKLVDVDGVKAIVTFSSGETLSVCPITEAKGIPLFSSGSSPLISKCGQNTFRNYPSDIYQGKVLAQKAQALGYKKAFIAYIDNDYGKGLEQEFIKNYTGQVVAEAHQAGERDFRTIVAKIKQEKPDTIILISQLAEGSQFLSQLAAQNVFLPILGSEALKEDALITKIPKTIAQYLSVTSVSEYSGNEALAFKSEYEEKYHEKYAAFANFVYDNVGVLGSALQNCSALQKQNDAGCVSGFVRDTQMTGATGNISFDEHGDIKEKPYTLFVISGDTFVAKGE
ncbi:MAG: ABC transporter substrate-binding protein [Candidatus Pacebacteria bacterium]|nr:ABC transporter substrate-binding protein [Candidatus Paceibacterota bacterium]